MTQGTGTKGIRAWGGWQQWRDIGNTGGGLEVLGGLAILQGG